jgi:hypothetical protein
MKRWTFALAGLLGLGSSGVASAQDLITVFHRSWWRSDCPSCQPIPVYPAPTPVPAVTEPKKEVTPKTEEPKVAPPKIDFQPNFESPISAALGESSFAMAAPQMMGDFGGFCLRQTVFVPTTATANTTITIKGPIGTPLPPRQTTVLTPVEVCTPVAGRTGSNFKIGDDESPIPTDRVFVTYNYFNGLQGMSGFTPPSSQTTVFNLNRNVTSVTTTTVPGVFVPASRLDVHNEMFGVEKTFLGGDASVEIRVPLFQTGGNFDGGFNGDHFGDLTSVFKFALINEPETQVFSVGVALTFPTGPTIPGADGRNIDSVLIQPFMGYLRNFGSFYALAFTSIVAPSDGRDTDLLFNDLTLGYRLRPGNGVFTSVTPVFEVHVCTPLEHDRELTVPDTVSFTSGVHLGIGSRSTLSLGVNVPVTGPRPYDVEALAQINFRF